MAEETSGSGGTTPSTPEELNGSSSASASSGEGGGPPPARRRSLVVRLLLIPVTLLALVVAALAILPAFVTPESVRQQAVEGLSEALGVQVGIESLDYDPLTGFDIEGITIGPPEGFEQDVLTLRRLSVRYALDGALSRRVEVRRLELSKPRVVLETRNGRRNLDAILENLGPSKAPSEPASPPDRRGAVSPVTVTLRNVKIEDLGVALAGEGPQVSLQGLHARLGASVDPRRVDAGLDIRAAHGGRQGAALQAVLTSTSGQPDVRVAGRLILGLTSTVAAKASRGLTVEDVSAAVEVGLANLTIEGAGDVPPVDARARASISVRPTEDYAQARLQDVVIAGESFGRVTLAVNGVSAAVEAAATAAVARLLALRTGLVRGEGDGDLRLSIPRFALPLSTLAPYAQVFVPGLRMSGAIGLEEVSVSGTVDELRSLSPRALKFALSASRAGVTLPSGISLNGVDGRWWAALDEAGSMPPSQREVRLGGTIRARDLVAHPARVGRAAVTLRGRLQSLRHPSIGLADVGLDVTLADVRAPGVALGEVGLSLGLRGRDPLAADRGGQEPIRVTLKARAPGARTLSSSKAVTLSDVALQAGLQMERLVPFSESGVTADASLNIAGVDLARDRTQVRDVLVKAGLTSGDPRSEGKTSATARVRVTVDRVQRPEAVLTGARVDLFARSAGLPALSSGRPLLPATVTASAALRLPRVVVDHPSTGKYVTAARGGVKLAAYPRVGRVRIARLSATIDDLLGFVASGDVRELNRSRPRIDGRGLLEKVDLARLVAHAPPALLKVSEGLVATGTIAADIRVQGRLPPPGARIDPLSPPFDARLNVRALGVGARLPAKGFEFETLSGTLSLLARRGRTQLQTSLGLGSMATRTPEGEVRVRDLQLAVDGGRRGETWNLEGDLRVGQLDGTGRGMGIARDARSALSVRYTPFGDLELRRMVLQAPGSGLDLALTGRLQRRRFGAFRPAVTIDARLDLDRLQAFLPTLEPTSGRVMGAMDVSAPDDETLQVSGAMRLDEVGYRTRDLTIVNATGRVPFIQRVLIPAPEVSATRRRGALGDDLEVRLRELAQQASEGWRLEVDESDILIDSPQTADYEALRPYMVADDARVAVDQVILANPTFGDVNLGAMSMDTIYSRGVFRLDRVAFQLWEGDVFGDMAMQVASEEDIRVRMRMTMTDVNFDVPTAPRLGLARATEGARQRYLFSGVTDLKLDVGDRSMNGNVDITKIGLKLVLRLIDSLDPEGTDSSLTRTRAGLSGVDGFFGHVEGKKLAGMKVWIRQNLLNQSFVWERPWFAFMDIGGQTEVFPQFWLPPVRLLQETIGFATEKTLGYRWEPSGVAVVPEIRRYNLAQFWANPVWSSMRTRLGPLRGRIAPRAL